VIPLHNCGIGLMEEAADMEPTLRLKIQIITPGMPSVKQLPNGNGNGAAATKGKGKDAKFQSADRITAFITALSEAPTILPELEALLKVRSENEELQQQLTDKERERISALDEKDKALEKREKDLQAVIDSKNALLEQEGKSWMDSIRQELSSESHSATLLQAKEKELSNLTAAHAAELERLAQTHSAAFQRLQAEADTKLQTTKKEMEAQLEVAKKAIVVVQTEREGYKARLEEVNGQLSQTKTLLAAEELHRKRREAELAKMQLDMGLRELVEPAL
jgi:chromosome segregation ATPase